jgi:hypothetical protein
MNGINAAEKVHLEGRSARLNQALWFSAMALCLPVLFCSRMVLESIPYSAAEYLDGTVALHRTIALD